jgi:hypothetical protein
MFASARKFAMPLADGSEGRIFASMADILESAPKYHEEPKLVIRKAPHVPVWSVWATLEGTHSEAIQPQRRPLSVVSPIGDKLGRGRFVRFVPIAADALHQTASLFDHLVGASEQRQGTVFG